MLTQDDLTELKKPFAASEVKFLRGLAYITEYAITERMDEIDPSWSFGIQEVTNRDGTISVIGNLTIKGVTRSNIGMDSVRETKDGNSEANEAEKSTATDALKRCARLFGIGRYLLNLPRDVRDESSMARWLKAQGQAPGATTGNGSQPSNVTSLPPQSNASGSSDSTDEAWLPKIYALTEFLYDGVKKHQENSINKLIRERSITADMKPIAAATIAFAHKAYEKLRLSQDDITDQLGKSLGDYLRSGKTLQDAWQDIQPQHDALPPTGTDDIPF